MKRIVLLLLLTAFIAAGAFAGGAKEKSGSASQQDLEGVPDPIVNHDGPIEIAVIRNLGSDDHTNQFLAGAVQEGRALGFTVDTFLSNGDDAKFQDFVTQAINQGYDGLILSHGKSPYSDELVSQALEEGMEVVTFDTALEESYPEVTQTAQNDHSLAELSLGHLMEVHGDEANIIKLWVAGFPPMERRQEVYSRIMEENPGLNELESIGAVSSDVPGDTANKVGAILSRYPEGEIDAIWASWDAFAQGAYTALTENNRTEIDIFSIDVSNRDLQLMQEEGSPWVSTAAVDPQLIGRIDLRLVAKKIAGEETPQSYELPAHLIKSSQLEEADGTVNMSQLGQVVEGWGELDAFEEPWFDTLREANAE
jgi:simple sugar transport system substrate-binding protein